MGGEVAMPTGGRGGGGSRTWPAFLPANQEHDNGERAHHQNPWRRPRARPDPSSSSHHTSLPLPGKQTTSRNPQTRGCSLFLPLSHTDFCPLLTHCSVRDPQRTNATEASLLDSGRGGGGGVVHVCSKGVLSAGLMRNIIRSVAPSHAASCSFVKSQD